MTRGCVSGSSWHAVAPVCTMAYPRDWFHEFKALSLVILNVDWPCTHEARLLAGGRTRAELDPTIESHCVCVY